MQAKWRLEVLPRALFRLADWSRPTFRAFAWMSQLNFWHECASQVPAASQGASQGCGVELPTWPGTRATADVWWELRDAEPSLLFRIRFGRKVCIPPMMKDLPVAALRSGPKCTRPRIRYQPWVENQA